MTTHNVAPNDGATVHAAHDRLLVAALAAGDVVGDRDVARATALLSDCEACRALHDELRAIATATRSLPTPVRPAARDFRISQDRAEALRRGSIVRRVLRPFGRGSGTVRPLAMAFSTLGVAGLLLAALPSMPITASFFLGSTGASAEVRDLQAESGDPEAQLPGDHATDVPAGGIDTSGGGPAAPTPGATTDQQYSQGGSGGGEANGAGPGEEGGGATDGDSSERIADSFFGADGPSPLVLLSVGFLGAGIALFLLRRAALRQR